MLIIAYTHEAFKARSRFVQEVSRQAELTHFHRMQFLKYIETIWGEILLKAGWPGSYEQALVHLIYIWEQNKVYLNWNWVKNVFLLAILPVAFWLPRIYKLKRLLLGRDINRKHLRIVIYFYHTCLPWSGRHDSRHHGIRLKTLWMWN